MDLTSLCLLILTAFVKVHIGVSSQEFHGVGYRQAAAAVGRMMRTAARRLHSGQGSL